MINIKKYIGCYCLVLQFLRYLSGFFCANGHMTVTLSTQLLSTVNYHRGTQVSPNLTEYLAYHFVHGNFQNVSSSYA